MDSPLEQGGAGAGREESEPGIAEHSYAAEDPDQGRTGDTPILTNAQRGREIDEVEELPVSSSKRGDRLTGERNRVRKSREEESDSSTGQSSENDSEMEGDSVPRGEASAAQDSSLGAAEQGVLAGKEEVEGHGKSFLVVEPRSDEVLWKGKYTAPLLSDDAVREFNEITPEIAESSKQVLGGLTSGSPEYEVELLGDNAKFPASICQEEHQRDKNSVERLELLPVEESKPFSSPVRTTKDEGLDVHEFNEHGSEDVINVKDDYVKKGFTCDGETDEDDKELREYWTRALQTSTSTGEIVEEIVNVLKHHQKTHDLLCPVCGSCVTRRVILRKRKRSSSISVDRWYRDTLDEEEVQEQEDPSPEVTEAAEEPDTREDHDVEAFGCLSCFSLFFNKGRHFFSQLQADIGPDTFNCLPFFFPPYPWGMTQRRPRSIESIVRSEEVDVSLEPTNMDVRASFTCGMGSTLLPDYPWGTMPHTSTGSSLVVTEEAPLLGVEDSSSMGVSPDFTCGIGSTLLPAYPWGAMHFPSKEKPLDQTDLDTDIRSQDVEAQREGTVERSPGSIEERTCSCGVVPNFLPAYPWGVCGKQNRELEDARGISQFVEASEPSTDETRCTCGIAQALFPEYQWGYLKKTEDVTPQSPSDLIENLEDSSPALPMDANLASVSQPEISEEVPEISEEVTELEREEKNSTCGLLPATLPDYSWGTFEKNTGRKSDKQARTAKETEGKEAEDSKSMSCVPALLPDYPWGMTSESQEISGDIPMQKGNTFFQNGARMRIGSAVLPTYPWGKCSIHRAGHDQNGRVQLHEDAADRDCTCGLGFTMLPKFPWGQQTLSTGTVTDANKNDQTVHRQEVTKNQTASRQEVTNYIEQETKIEARITSKTDVYTVTNTQVTYPGGEKPPQNVKATIPNETSQSLQHVKLDQRVTILDASVSVDEAASGIKGLPIASLPSTGFALLDLAEEGLGGKERLEKRPSTGYAYIEELHEEPELPISEIKEDPASIKYIHSEAKSDNRWELNSEKNKPQVTPTGTQFPSFAWSVGKLDAVDLTAPLMKAPVDPESETFISVFKPSPGGTDQPKDDNWLSIFKVSKPPDEGGLTAPLLSPALGYTEEIEEVKPPVSHPQIQVVSEATVIDVPPGDSGGSAVGTTAATAPALTVTKKKEANEWDILKPIVYGGLDISIASLGVTSSAAGGNAITRTVVYMGVATLFSGLIGFYHNVLNLYNYHTDHFTDVVGLTLKLHGIVALISFVVFGLLSPLTYAFSYRETDDRDNKFILCCAVTIIAVTALALGKAKVSNKRYIRTVSAYLLGGVLAAIVGYLTGEHVADLLEQWGI